MLRASLVVLQFCLTILLTVQYYTSYNIVCQKKIDKFQGLFATLQIDH